jgi:hypothetical protein
MSEEPPHTNDGDGLEVADPNDYFVTGKPDDAPDPVLQQIPGTDQALRIRPLMNHHLERFGKELESDDPDDSVVAEVFNYALADFDGEITADMVEQGLIGYSAMPILQAIKNASNYKAFLGYQEEERRHNLKNLDMMDKLKDLDQEQMDTLMAFAEKNGKPSVDTS